jgi:uncharacterized protein YjdB
MQTTYNNRTHRIKFITAKIYPKDATNVKIKYKSSKPKKASIDKTGYMLMTKKGVYTVTVRVGKIKRVMKVRDYEYPNRQRSSFG